MKVIKVYNNLLDATRCSYRSLCKCLYCQNLGPVVAILLNSSFTCKWECLHSFIVLKLCWSLYFETLFSEMLTLIKHFLFSILHSECLQHFASTNHKIDSKLSLSCCFPSYLKPFKLYHHQNMEIQTID